MTHPLAQLVENNGYKGHECIVILNTNPLEARVVIDYYGDKDPVEGITMIVPAKRIKAFRSSDREVRWFGAGD